MSYSSSCLIFVKLPPGVVASHNLILDKDISYFLITKLYLAISAPRVYFHNSQKSYLKHPTTYENTLEEARENKGL